MLQEKEDLRVYEMYRAYIVHEDDVVNQRTTWSITIQFFTIATLGFSYQKRMEIVSNFCINHIQTPFVHDFLTRFDRFMMILAVFGCAVSFISGLSAYAAQRAIKSIRASWKATSSKHTEYQIFPALTGGGDRQAHILGHLWALVLPIFFVVFWIGTISYLWLMHEYGLDYCPAADSIRGG